MIAVGPGVVVDEDPIQSVAHPHHRPRAERISGWTGGIVGSAAVVDC